MNIKTQFLEFTQECLVDWVKDKKEHSLFNKGAILVGNDVYVVLLVFFLLMLLRICTYLCYVRIIVLMDWVLIVAVQTGIVVTVLVNI